MLILLGFAAVAVALSSPGSSIMAGRIGIPGLLGLLGLLCQNCAYQANHGAYSVTVSPLEGSSGKYGAGVVFDERTVSGINAFSQANRELSPSVFARHSTVRTMVTFSRPLSFDDFRKLMSHSEITVHEFGIRNRTVDGQRTTAYGEPRGAEIAPGHLYTSVVPTGEVFEGFFYADVTLTSRSYAALAASPDVYLLDITDALVRDEVRGRYDIQDIYRTSPYWNMEDLGLVK
jgi:hypothetical protein